MVNETYYIYHIPGVKIGCATNVKRRTKEQGFSDFEIIEEHTNIYQASDREQELQKQYGYIVDKIPYHKTYKQRKDTFNIKNCIKGGTIQGRKNVESGHLKSISSIGGKAVGKLTIVKMPLEDKVLGGKIAGSITSNRIHNCPHCNKDIKGRVYFRWHGENCKYA